MAKAVDTRLKRARFHWENRRKEEAERLGRDTKETLEWKIFPDAVKVRPLAPPNDVPHCMWGTGAARPGGLVLAQAPKRAALAVATSNRNKNNVCSSHTLRIDLA